MVRRVVPALLAIALPISVAQASQPSSPARHESSIASRAKPRLTLRPKVVVPGGRLTLTGSGFRPNERVWLGVGPPQSEALFWGSSRTNRAGFFRKTLTVNPRVTAGRWITVACQRGCRIRASASFETVLGRG